MTDLNFAPLPFTGDASCPTCRKPLSNPVRLVSKECLGTYLSLPEDKLEWLINTHKLPKIRLWGEVFFDLRDVDQIVLWRKFARPADIPKVCSFRRSGCDSATPKTKTSLMQRQLAASREEEPDTNC